MKLALIGLLFVPNMVFAANLVCSVAEATKTDGKPNGITYVKSAALVGQETVVVTEAKLVPGLTAEVAAAKTSTGSVQLTVEVTDAKTGATSVTALPAPSAFITNVYTRGDDTLALVCSVR
jgi:hypothetical protein